MTRVKTPCFKMIILIYLILSTSLHLEIPNRMKPIKIVTKISKYIILKLLKKRVDTDIADNI